MSGGIPAVQMHNRSPAPEVEEEDDKNSTVRETPEEGMMDKVKKFGATLEKPGWKGALKSVAVIGLAVFILLVVLPGLLHFNILSPTSSMNNLPMLTAILVVGAVGLIGLGAQIGHKSKTMQKIWMVVKAILPFILAAGAMWYGVDTLKTLIHQGQFFTGPFNWAILALGGGFIYGTSMVSTTLFA